MMREAQFLLVHTFNQDKTPENFDPINTPKEELSKFATLRHKIRIKYPGLCAYFFECVLDAVLQNVVETKSRKKEVFLESHLPILHRWKKREGEHFMGICAHLGGGSERIAWHFYNFVVATHNPACWRKITLFHTNNVSCWQAFWASQNIDCERFFSQQLKISVNVLKN